MNSRASRWAALFVVGIAATALRCADRDVSRIIGTNLPAPDDSDAGADPTRCVPGQTLACIGACGGDISAGYQVCAEDGRSYGECICPPAGERTFISIEPGTVLLSPEAVPRIRLPDPRPIDQPAEPGLVGAPCAADTDCEGDLSCLTSSSTLIAGGGIAGGYCTTDCASNADCTRIDPVTACVALGGQNMCVRLCLSQTPPAENEPKCLFRPDLTCVSSAILSGEQPNGERQVGICAPQCQSDASCGGRTCDLARGICTDTPRPGGPIGTACEGAEQCAGGVCLGLSQGTESACSAFCTLGAAGCGFQSGETPGAACLLTQIPGEGIGDRGLCIEVCDTPADCIEPGSECAPLEASPRAGVCVRFTSSPPIDPPDAGPPDNEPPDTDPPDDGGSPEPTPTVGLPCELDDECGGGVCLTSDGNPLGIPGGPANGYCSASCDATTSCERGAVCLALFPESGLCFLGCSPADGNACHGRDTLECTVPNGSQNGFCQPRCNSDDDCGERVCDPGPNGLCIDPCTSDDECESGDCDESTGHCIPGPPCTLDADCGDRICNVETDTCARAPSVPAGGACLEDADCPGDVCLPITRGAPQPTPGFCSSLCASQTSIGCELYGTDSFCLLGSGQQGLGFCVGLCNVAADCAIPGFRCVSIGGNVNGNTGACIP